MPGDRPRLREPEPQPEDLTAFLALAEHHIRHIAVSESAQSVGTYYAPRLLAAVEAALAQHQPTRSNEDGKLICDKCSFAYRTAWPCGEYEAISRALLGEGE